VTQRNRSGNPRPARQIALSDPEILSRLATGELDALGELYDRYQESVRQFIARATCDAEDVDDLLHATFLAAARAAGRYDGRASCRPWLIGIAAQHVRRKRRRISRLLAVLSSVSSLRAQNVDPRATLHARSDIERALLLLTETKRITFLMAELEGLSCAEIAETLRIPVGTVWTRLHAARRELRQALREGGQL
jgi:RNA polymerase sigma-70 factor, ECF subfamily